MSAKEYASRCAWTPTAKFAHPTVNSKLCVSGKRVVLHVVFAMICPFLVLTLISATQLAELIGKCHRTAFGAKVEVWTADATWKPLNEQMPRPVGCTA